MKRSGRLLPRVLFAVAGVAGWACHLGQRVESFAPANGPEGVSVSLTFEARAAIAGELLAVDDTALVVLSDQAVVLVPYRFIRRGRFEDLAWASLTGGATPAPDLREKLRLVSRFPQGISPNLLAALVAAYGQPLLKVAVP